MSKDEYEKRFEAAEQASRDANERVPDSSAWGMFTFGVPAAIGGSVGVFLWFETRDDLLEFAAEGLCFAPHGLAGSNALEVTEKVREVIGRVRTAELDWEAGRIEVNGILRKFSQIEWWGVFADLRSAEHPYAAIVVNEFREQQTGEPSAADGDVAEIGDDELEEFREFISTWGLFEYGGSSVSRLRERHRVDRT